MKLIYCPHCGDILRLYFTARSCRCGKAGGYYRDRLNATITGNAIPLGFDNASFVAALIERPDDGAGRVFQAFIIPKKCDTVEVI